MDGGGWWMCAVPGELQASAKEETGIAFLGVQKLTLTCGGEKEEYSSNFLENRIPRLRISCI